MTKTYSSPTVSILIPCYNAEKWIKQAITSALSQTYKNKEVIVLDDGSTDGSLSIISTFGSRVRWETGPNRGGNHARNRLLSISNGDWIQYLDADDYLLPKKIENQVQFLRSVADAEVIYSPHITEHKGEQGIFQEMPDLESCSQNKDLWLLAIKWHLPQTGGLLIHRQALIDINGWREGLKHCQDYDLYFRLLKAQKQFAYCNHADAVYRWWCSGTVTHRNVIEIYRDRLDVQSAIEHHLRETGQLTDERKDAIYQAKFEYARRIYAWDKQWAARVAEGVRTSDPNFLPSAQIAPGLYRKLYRTLGFAGAEYIADIKRQIWN